MFKSGTQFARWCRKLAIPLFALTLSLLIHTAVLWGLPSWTTQTHFTPPPPQVLSLSLLPPPPLPAPHIAHPRPKTKPLPPPPKPKAPPLPEETVEPTVKKQDPVPVETPPLASQNADPALDSPATTLPPPQEHPTDNETTPKPNAESASTLEKSTDNSSPQIPSADSPERKAPQTPIILAYTLHWKNIALQATYTLLNDDTHYRINFQAEGTNFLTRILAGSGAAQSEGRIEADGLHPEHYWQEHRSRQEITFHTDSPSVTFGGKNTQPLPVGPRALDPLALILQFYFSPPDPSSSRRLCTMVSPSGIEPCHFEREAPEKIDIHGLSIDTEVWAHYNSKGILERRLWLAPSFFYMPIQIQDFTKSILLKLERINNDLIHT